MQASGDHGRVDSDASLLEASGPEPARTFAMQQWPGTRVLAVAAMLAIGALVAVQSQVNGRLAAELGDGARAGALAALISFGSGLLFLTVLVAVEPSTRRGLVRVASAVRSGALRWWQVVGGVVGALIVASQGFTVSTIGVALFTVALVAGQSASSLVVDHIGFGPAGHKRISAVRLLGAFLTVAAVVLAVAERVGGTDGLGPTALALALLPLVAGCGAAYQQAVNGLVNQVGGPWATAWNNFLVGTSLLLVLAGGSLTLPGNLRSLPGEWWLYTGGLMGVVFISAAAVLVRLHGVLVLGLCTVAGQVIGAVAIDALTQDARVGSLSFAGAGLTLVGVAVASAPGLKRQKAGPQSPDCSARDCSARDCPT